MSISDEIRAALESNGEARYKAFQGGLIPTLGSSAMLGVRTPVLRKLAKQFAKERGIEHFLGELPHRYYEENALHAFIIEQIADFDGCVHAVEVFLPYIDNWAVCDGLSPKIFFRQKERLFPYCVKWLGAEHTYTVRFALVMLLKHFLVEGYAEEALRMAASVDSEEYYINIAVAWLFAEAMGKCPTLAQPYFEQRLKTEIHNKAIQKTVESRKVPEETKAYLKTLKRKKS